MNRNKIIKYLLCHKTGTNKYIQKHYGHYKIFIEQTGNDLLNKHFGGGKILTPEFSVTFDGNKYNFYKDEIDNDFFILYSLDNKNKCVVIEIDQKNQIATIQDIQSEKNCTYNKHKVGSTLLQITLKLLLKLSLNKKYNIKIIILSDDSHKYCPAIKENIDMKIMNTLLTGHTWYGAYGFRPVKYKNDKLILDQTLNEKYNQNIIIMNKLKISDIDLYSYFANIKFIETNQLYAIKQIISKNPDMLLKDFLSNMLKDFDSSCKLFNEFYMKLHDDIGLKNTGTFYGYSF